MGRKVFISFLGTGFYELTRYIHVKADESLVTPLRFVQEATIRKFCVDFSANDVIYIFTTDGSLLNWNDNEHTKVDKTKEFYDGLSSNLKALSLNCSFENIPISDGKSTDEIWDIFKTVFEKLHEKDELIFDITHGFRSLPVLNMVLINYAKLLKNISVKGIFYGAFEAKYKKNDIWYSPVWDLKSFEELQEWTNNANFLLNGGNGLPLVKQMEEQYPEVRIHLEKFSKSILTSRGNEIYGGIDEIKLNQSLEIFRNKYTQLSGPLEPIFSKIRNEFSQYAEDSSINGFLASRWCIKYGLIPQAGTIFTEFIISFILEFIDEKEFIFSNKHRNFVSYFLQVEEDTIETSIELDSNWQQSIICKMNKLPKIDILKANYSKIAKQLRNDLNHAGFRDEPKNYEEFEKLLKDNYMTIKSYLKEQFNISIPKL